MKCKICHYAHTDKPGYQLNQDGDMRPSIFHKLINEVSGKPLIAFTGGEPLLHPEVANFIAYAKKKDLVCSLTTNGWLLPDLAEALCEAGLDLLVISVDGPRDTHNSIRGKYSFDRLVAGLSIISGHPKKPIIFISMAISDQNYDKLISTYELAKSWNVNGINFNHLWIQTNKMVRNLRALHLPISADSIALETDLDLIDTQVLADQLETIRRQSWGGSLVVAESPYLNRQEISTWYQEPEKPVKYKSVRCGWILMKIWPDGKIKPCRDWVAGDITKQNLMEIWNQKDFSQFREHLAETGMLPICTRCCLIARR
jgi:MoaA/NifB/PqqE/SkfB family radical SAM enzyme